MVGKRVFCRIRSALETKSVFGTIVQRCTNSNVFVLKLDHSVYFVNGRVYNYPKGSTLLVAESEIVK